MEAELPGSMIFPEQHLGKMDGESKGANRGVGNSGDEGLSGVQDGCGSS